MLLYLLWKLNTLIEKAKTKAKSTVKPTTATATTPKKSCLKPKKLSRNCCTVRPLSSMILV